MIFFYKINSQNAYMFHLLLKYVSFVIGDFLFSGEGWGVSDKKEIDFLFEGC